MREKSFLCHFFFLRKIIQCFISVCCKSLWTTSSSVLYLCVAKVCESPHPVFYICVLQKFVNHHLLKKKQIKTWRIIPATDRTSCLRLNANDHNWWTTMPMKRHQQSCTEKKKKKKKMKTKHARHFQLGNIHNPVKLFWVLRLITCFNVSNNFTTTNASNILSEFPCSLIQVSHF